MMGLRTFGARFLGGVALAACMLAMPACVSRERLPPVPEPLPRTSFTARRDLDSLLPDRIALRQGSGNAERREKRSPDAGGSASVRKDGEAAEAPSSAGGERTINLAEALEIGGANSLQVALAREQLELANARLDQANVSWLPDIVGGVAYRKHEGALQETQGEVLRVSRNAGAVGAGVFADFNFADALLEPESAFYGVDAADAGVSASVNDTLLSVALAHSELLEAQAGLALAKENISLAEELVSLTEAFARSGQGLEADAARARNELARRKRLAVAAELTVDTRAARLATLLRLDPAVPLRASEPRLIPFELIPEKADVRQLIKLAMDSRPEVRALDSSVRATEAREEQERLRPFIPRLQLGVSGGGLGGGTGSDFRNFGDEAEFSAGLVWEIRNLGFGESAARRRRAAEARRAKIQLSITRDAVAEQVGVAFVRARDGRRQVELAVQNVKESLSSLDLNLQRIRAAEGLPIEVLQAFQAAATARDTYIETVGQFNRAQFDLLRAVGRPVTP